MGARRVWVSLVLVLAGFLVVCCEGVSEEIKFDLPKTGSRCILEGFAAGLVVKGEVLLTDGPGNVQVDLFISMIKGGTVLFSKRSIEHDTFKFTLPGSNERGSEGKPPVREIVRFCVIQRSRISMANAVPRHAILKYHSEKPGDKRSESVKSNETRLDRVAVTLDTVMEMFDGVSEGIEMTAHMEKYVYEQSERTSKAVVIYSVFSCVFLILAGVYRVYLAQNDLKRLKLI
uniref:GOLD domain-containing protein n=1 Tax=Rhodosorus marinus TaxID=101924 RepID=A0A7S0BMR7_9RHOD|mmetsp:Transcript_23024/g.33102  ORF Transcript_23024/g.33102 Transcript_23024/m.33102 type:complete len:231 (+) Transcript_23024:137-829(+)